MSSIAWFEIPAKDNQRARDFYGGLLGWQFQPFEEGSDYQMAGEAGGAIYSGNGQPGVLVYFGVDDLDSAIAKVGELGGEAGERQEIPNVGSYAVCTDSEGNRFGLYHGQSA